MNYYSCKSFEKKIFSSTKKINFYELLLHKRYEKNIFISSKKNFLSSNRVEIKVIWIKVWLHLDEANCLSSKSAHKDGKLKNLPLKN